MMHEFICKTKNAPVGAFFLFRITRYAVMP
ncbi:MAG: hypothetical protein FCKEOINB_02426 [Nitrosomonas sp.]|nr:hypothetical protein [Nitrosomonas sp.]